MSDESSTGTLPPRSQDFNQSPNLLKPNKAKGNSDAGKTLPNSADAERSVISCLLQSPSADLLGEAIEKLPSHECFYLPAHQIIYETILDMNVAIEPIDLVTVTQKLIDQKRIDELGGPSILAEIFHFVATTAHFTFYLDIVLQKYMLRSVILSCTDCITRAHEDQENVEALIDDVEREILSIRESRKTRSFANMKDEVMDAISMIEEMYNNKGSISGLSSGFTGLDKLTNGFRGGEMIVIAARPSMGKTSFVMNVIENVSVAAGVPTAVFSLEMPTSQLVLRLLCARAGIEMSKIAQGFLSHKTDFPKLMEAASKLAASPIFVDDSPALSILELRAKARRLKKQHDIKLIAIDYLQLMRSTSRRAADNRQLEISEISSGLKSLAKELDIPVIVLAQLNRGPENRGGTPKLSDLRESGAIEQDADMVGLLLREKYYAESEEEAEQIQGKSELIIAKNRNGPTGHVPLVFLDKFMRFVDRAPDDDEDGFG